MKTTNQQETLAMSATARRKTAKPIRTPERVRLAKEWKKLDDPLNAAINGISRANGRGQPEGLRAMVREAKKLIAAAERMVPFIRKHKLTHHDVYVLMCVAHGESEELLQSA